MHHLRTLILLGLLALPVPLTAQNIPLPNPPQIFKVELSDVSRDCNEDNNCVLSIPWIGEYISQLYVFAVSISALLAVVVIMIAGMMWLLAGGNTSQVENARAYIKGAIMGLILMLGSYVLLYTINPKLVRFDGLRLPIVKNQPLGEYYAQFNVGNNVIKSCSATVLGGNTIENSLKVDFNAAYQEFGVNPVYLAAIAMAESTFRPSVESDKKAYGLMQITPTTASHIWNTTSVRRPTECSGENDPGKGSYTETCKQWMTTHQKDTIRMGAAYLAQINNQLDKCKYKDNWTLVAAGYNAGPNRKSLCEGEVPPFKETVDYVQNVNRYLEGFCYDSQGQLSSPTEEENEEPAE